MHTNKRVEDDEKNMISSIENTENDIINPIDITSKKPFNDYGSFNSFNNTGMSNNYYENTLGVSPNRDRDYMNLDLTKGVAPRNNNQNRYNFDSFNEVSNYQDAYNANLAKSIHSKNYESLNSLDLNNIGFPKSSFNKANSGGIKSVFVDKIEKILNQDINHDFAINMINKGMSIIDRVIADGNGVNMEMIQIGSHLIDQGITILNRDIDIIEVIQKGINIYGFDDYF